MRRTPPDPCLPPRVLTMAGCPPRDSTQFRISSWSLVRSDFAVRLRLGVVALPLDRIEPALPRVLLARALVVLERLLVLARPEVVRRESDVERRELTERVVDRLA